MARPRAQQREPLEERQLTLAMSALALLRRGRELVATPAQWTTGAHARNAAGQLVAPRLDEEPVSFCATGALLCAEHELHGTWVEPEPGLYFEDSDGRMTAPPRLLLALDVLAAELLREFSLAVVRRGRFSERRIAQRRTALNPRLALADALDFVNDHPAVDHRAVLSAYDNAIREVARLTRPAPQPPQSTKPSTSRPKKRDSHGKGAQ
jgi:hypothetical protein